MKRVYAATAVVAAVVLAAFFLIFWLRQGQGTGPAQPDGGHASDRYPGAGWKEIGLPDPAAVTMEAIKRRWPPDLKPHRLYRRLVLELAQYPLETRLQWYLRFAPRLSAGGKGGILEYLARELTFQGEFEVLDALEASLDSPGQKRALYIYVSGVTIDPRLREYLKPGVVAGGRKLLRKWALAHPDRIELMAYHPDGFRLLSDILADQALDGTLRSEAAFEMRGMVGIGAVSAEKAIRALHEYVDDPAPVDLGIPAYPGRMYTLGTQVKDNIEAIRLICEAQGDSGDTTEWRFL